MFRSRAPRVVVAALTAVVLIVGLMASTTSAAPKPKPTPTPTPVPSPTPTPTPTPNSDNRTVYFGDAPKSASGDGVLIPSIVTAGNTFGIEIFIENEGNQRLTHAEVGYGSLAVARTDTSDPSLPAGSTIVSATLNGQPCTITADLLGALCDLGNFDSGETATVLFIVTAPSPGATATWASFKVAENVPDQGANRNTFYADASFVVGPTNTNGNGTFKLANEDLTASTANQTLVKKDSMTTTVSAPGEFGGAISISEADCDSANPCSAGQIATVHVRDGAPVDLVWTLVIVGQLDHPITVTHELDSGLLEFILESNTCDTDTETNCMVDVIEQGNSTRLIFKTPTNGRVHG